MPRDRKELMENLAKLEKRMREPEHGQTTFSSLRNEIAILADALWMVLDQEREE